MPDHANFALFFAAALILALTPGPGILYVLARSIGGGTGTGIASTGGTALGGFGHVLAAAFGLSALIAASASAFTVVKLAGAAYLIILGFRTLLAREDATIATGMAQDGRWRAFGQGIVTELLNPKTALFFLAFIPQFITPGAQAFAQFVVLGTIAVLLNTGVDLIVALLAGPIATRLRRSSRLRRGQRYGSGGVLIALGVSAGVAGTSG